MDLGDKLQPPTVHPHLTHTNFFLNLDMSKTSNEMLTANNIASADWLTKTSATDVCVSLPPTFRQVWEYHSYFFAVNISCLRHIKKLVWV